eukprot:14778068-Ditylum_brightwellii.AAC.1
MPEALKQIALQNSLGYIAQKGGISMLTDDVVDLLETEHIHILSQVTNKNNVVLQKGISSVSMCMSCRDGAGSMVSAVNLDTAQNGKFNETLNGTLENALLTVPTTADIFESTGFGTQNILEWKNSKCGNNSSLQDAVECIDFLDTIELNNDDNSICVDLDAVNDNLV